MSDQPEALRLADALRDGMPYDEAEIEHALRRLHEENERLRIVAGMSTLLLVQRDALLEALRFIADHDLRGADLTVCGRIAHGLVGRARDAIKAAEDAPDR